MASDRGEEPILDLDDRFSNPKDALRILPGLITLSLNKFKTKIVTFSHFTVRDYLFFTLRHCCRIRLYVWRWKDSWQNCKGLPTLPNSDLGYFTSMGVSEISISSFAVRRYTGIYACENLQITKFGSHLFDHGVYQAGKGLLEIVVPKLWRWQPLWSCNGGTGCLTSVSTLLHALPRVDANCWATCYTRWDHRWQCWILRHSSTRGGTIWSKRSGQRDFF